MARGHVRIALCCAALAAGALLASATTAWGARGLTTGFADPLYASPDAATRQMWLDRTVDARAGIVRLEVKWSSIAPTRPANPLDPADPAYNFARLDAAIVDATARGLAPLLTVVYAPPWAEGANRPPDAPPGTWRPQAAEFGHFGSALATRYGGSFPNPAGGGALPRVRYLQPWNEPSLSVYLTPQGGRKKRTGALIYRELLNAFFAGVKAVRPDDVVVTAGTAPYGDPKGGSRTPPVAFWRAVFCLKERGKGKRKKLRPKKCRNRPMLDVLAHHPIGTIGKPTRRAVNRDDAGSADLGRIRRVLRAAERFRKIKPKGRHPLWATETWWLTNPPDATLGFPPATQARFLEQALYLIWRGGGSVAINLQIRDGSLPTGGVDSSGVFSADGSPKPSFTALRFPFVTERIGRARLRAWGKAPVAGTLAIEQLRGGVWRPLRSLSVSAGQVFVARLKLRGRQQLRATIAAESSLIWVQR